MSKIVRNIPDGLEASYADIKLDTISDLANLTGTPPDIVWVSGYHTKGDGSYGSHIFEWDPNSTEPHNGGTIIELGATFPTDWSDSAKLDAWYNYSGGTTGRYKLRYDDAVNVGWFGIFPNGIDYSAEMQIMYDTLHQWQAMQFGEGEYLGYIQCLTNNTSIIGMGSGLTTIKIPNGAIKNTVDEDGVTPISGVPNVIDLGETNRGNNAVLVSGISVSGLTLDGNKANTDVPTLDLFGWGLTQTKHSYFNINDVSIKNCHNGGIGTFINSNYGKMDVYVENCDGIQGGQPQVDFNSSKFIDVNCVTKGGNYGGRILDNCLGINYKGSHHMPAIGGFGIGNQTVNYSQGNNISLSIVGGCSSNALSIGANVTSTYINLVANSINGHVYESVDLGINQSHGNTVEITSSNSQNGNVIKSFDNSTSFKLLSSLDSSASTQFENYCVLIEGSNNTFDINIEDTASGQIRDIQFATNSSNNTVKSFYSTHTNPLIVDSGTSNRITPINGVGADLPSGNEIRIDWKNSIFTITGNDSIVNIVDPAVQVGKTILFKFTGTPQVLETGNISLTSGFTATVGSWIQLMSDGVKWYEVSRKIA